MSTEFNKKVSEGINNYSMTDAFLSANNKVLIVNIIYFIIALVYLTLVHKYNTPYHWIVIVTSIAVCIMNLLDKKSKKSWLKYFTIIFTSIFTITYIIPYVSTSEIILHTPLTTVAVIVNVILFVYIIGLILSVNPSTSSMGASIVSRIYI
jgi:hypothetical protein